MRSPRSCALSRRRPRTARQLADRFEVSVRTIERDLGALMEAGVPVYATPGPGGGYAVDRTRTLPPVNFSPDEATALALALARSADSPFAGRLRSALRKVVGAMSPDDADRCSSPRRPGSPPRQRRVGAQCGGGGHRGRRDGRAGRRDRLHRPRWCRHDAPRRAGCPGRLRRCLVLRRVLPAARRRAIVPSRPCDRGPRRPTSERRTTSTSRWPEGCPTPSGACPCSKSDIPVIPDRTLSPRCLRIGA